MGSAQFFGFKTPLHKEIEIECGFVIRNKAFFHGIKGLKIGSNVNLLTNVEILTTQQDYNSLNFDDVKAPVVKNYSRITSDHTLLPQLAIVYGDLVDAKTLVNNNPDARTIVVRVQALKVAVRSKDLEFKLSGLILPHV